MRSSALAFHDLSSLATTDDIHVGTTVVTSHPASDRIVLLDDSSTQQPRAKRPRFLSYNEAQTAPQHRLTPLPNNTLTSLMACSSRDAAMALYQEVVKAANATASASRESEMVLPKALMPSAKLTHMRLNSLVSPRSSYSWAATEGKEKSAMTHSTTPTSTRYLLTSFPTTTEDGNTTRGGDATKEESESSDVAQIRKSFEHATIISLPSSGTTSNGEEITCSGEDSNCQIKRRD